MMGLETLRFWILAALVLKDLVWLTHRDQSSQSAEPLRLLDERLARGEVDAAQYVGPSGC